jgi:hypothetical protein
MRAKLIDWFANNPTLFSLGKMMMQETVILQPFDTF